MLLHSARDADPSWLRKTFQPSRDIDRIAEQIVALHHDVADVNANAESHLLIGEAIGVLFGYGVLYFNSTLHCVHGTREVS
jgi:hypothetical protein